MDTVRIPAKKHFGQPVVFKVDTLRATDNWAFLVGQAIQPNGTAIDYTKSEDYTKDPKVTQTAVKAGILYGGVVALLKKEEGNWKMIAVMYDATTADWLDWEQHFGAPKNLITGPSSPAAIAQTATNGKSDEQLLRKLIQEDNEGKNVIKRTEDSIFVSGAYPRPMVGHAAQEALGSSKDRSNESRKGEVVRLVISHSGDMAEEFGNFTLSFDQPDKKHISFDGSYLRVWRKIKGEWLEDAFFARPNEPEEKTKNKSGP